MERHDIMSGCVQLTSTSSADLFGRFSLSDFNTVHLVMFVLYVHTHTKYWFAYSFMYLF